MAFMMLAITWWVVLYALEVGSPDPVFKVVANRAKFLGIVTVPVLWFVFSLYYTARGNWLSRRNLVLLFVFPALTTIVIGTNDLHHLMWSGAEIQYLDQIPMLDTHVAVWFWLHALYSYGLILAGDYFLLRQFIGSPRLYRRQLTALIIAMAVPLVANAITIFSTLLLDLTPFAFVITGLAITWGLLRYQLLDLAPVARNAVIDSMTDGMIVLDLQERVVDLNAAAQKIIDRPMAEIIGQPLPSVIRLLSEQPELLERYRTSTSVQGEIVISNTGEPRYLDVRVSPLNDHRGSLSGRVIVFRDVTERKHAEQHIQTQNEALTKANQELVIARNEAEEATRLKSQFLATMSHELRTPLNSIIGYSEIMLAGMTGELTSEQQDYQQRIFANGEHLLNLINDVLDLSKIEAGRMDLLKKPFSLRQWLDEIVSQNRILAEAKGLKFDVNIDDQLPETVVGDSARLKQVVINLLSNAVKFTESGEVKIELGLNDDHTWQILVSDTGIGVPLHAQETIFEEFRQVDGSTSRQYGGTGLGLAIVRKLIIMMDGTIRVKSEMGKGSTFIINLPLIKEAEAAPLTTA